MLGIIPFYLFQLISSCLSNIQHNLCLTLKPKSFPLFVIWIWAAGGKNQNIKNNSTDEEQYYFRFIYLHRCFLLLALQTLDWCWITCLTNKQCNSLCCFADWYLLYSKWSHPKLLYPYPISTGESWLALMLGGRVTVAQCEGSSYLLQF